MDPVGLKLY